LLIRRRYDDNSGKEEGIGVDYDSRFICFINMCEFICDKVQLKNKMLILSCEMHLTTLSLNIHKYNSTAHAVLSV